MRAFYFVLAVLMLFLCHLSFAAISEEASCFPQIHRTRPEITFMKKCNFVLAALLFFLFQQQLAAQTTKPDTVKVGIYITSIHNIDFKQKEFTAILWLWLKYKRKDFNFLQNLEVPS